MSTKRNTFKQMFFVKKHRVNANGESPIYLRITINGKTSDMSVHRNIVYNMWDDKIGMAKPENKQLKSLNDYLFSIQTSIYEKYKYLRETNKEITPLIIKNAYLGIKDENEKIITLVGLFDEHNKELEKLIGIDYSKSTVTKYKSTLKHIKHYLLLEYHKDDIIIENVNNKFVKGFEFYLKTKKDCSHNTTMKYITIFKKIIKIAIANDWLKKDPFVNFKITTKKTERPFLSEDELKILINKTFSIERLEIVKDTFLFSCFTGLAHSDLKKLTEENIQIGSDGKLWVMINRTKTDVSSHIPILPVTEAIIKKYKYHPRCQIEKVLLPVLTNQKMNAYLKEIADICGIDKKLTTHIARHTFATTVTLNNDVPIETVSKMLGHSSIKMTKIYAKLLDKKVSRDMEHLHDKFNIAI